MLQVKEALGRRDVRQSHQKNAECRLSTTPPASLRLLHAANQHEDFAQCENLPSSAVVHRHGFVWQRTTRRSSVLPSAAASSASFDPQSRKPNSSTHEDN